MHSRIVGSIPGLSPLDASVISPSFPQNNQKCLQTLPVYLLGGELPQVRTFTLSYSYEMHRDKWASLIA